MPEDVLFESESAQDRADIAAYLRTIADKLERGDPITFAAGEDSVTVDPPARPEFEVKVEREGPVDGPTELGVEFELEWAEGTSQDGESGPLEIE